MKPLTYATSPSHVNDVTLIRLPSLTPPLFISNHLSVAPSISLPLSNDSPFSTSTHPTWSSSAPATQLKATVISGPTTNLTDPQPCRCHSSKARRCIAVTTGAPPPHLFSIAA